jgi:hypothetical protein
MPEDEEPLLALGIWNNIEGHQEAVEKVKDIIRVAVECPEEQNELKKTQLRQLALLNGTLREEDAVSALGSAWLRTALACSHARGVVRVCVCRCCGAATVAPPSTAPGPAKRRRTLSTNRNAPSAVALVTWPRTASTTCGTLAVLARPNARRVLVN